MQMDSKKYIDEKLDKMFSELGIELKKNMPESIEEFTLNWIKEKYGNRAPDHENDRIELNFLRKKVLILEKNLKEGSTQNIPELKQFFGQFEPTIEKLDEDSSSDSDSSDSDSDSSEDDSFVLKDVPACELLSVEEALEEVEKHPTKISISAEAYGRYNKKSSFNAVLIPKSDEVKNCLMKRLETCWMFERLEKDDKLVLIDAMKEVNFNKNDIVIKEGEKGDCLYIVESGTFNCVKSGNDGKQVLLKVYVEGEVFGELALIYNCARTATMIANEDNSTVYSLDRITFNHIVSNNTMRRNEKYMKMLANVPILETMDYT